MLERAESTGKLEDPESPDTANQDESTTDTEVGGVYRVSGTDSAGPPNLPDMNGWNDLVSDGPVHKLIDRSSAESAMEQRMAAEVTHHGKGAIFRLLDRLRKRGEYRKLQTIPDAWRSDLADFETRFGNMWEVIDYLRVAFALAEHGDRVPRLAPLLLVGGPGAGKTYFSSTFARWFGSGQLDVHLETAQSNAEISGSSEFWSNSRPGRFFDLLVDGSFGNPIVCLDEIDKTGGDNRYDPLASLYQLLEPTTAKSFRDLAYPWLPPLDASRVIWVATANDVSRLPEPILSRFRIFQVDDPLPHETRRLVRQIFADLIADLPEPLRGLRLSHEAAELLASGSPREVKQYLWEAIGRAVYERRKTVLTRHVSLNPSVSSVRRIGFV